MIFRRSDDLRLTLSNWSRGKATSRACDEERCDERGISCDEVNASIAAALILDIPVLARLSCRHTKRYPMKQPSTNAESGEKTIVVNRKARHDYHFSDSIEAGIALVGTEVKSLRQGKVNVTDSFVRVENGEAFVHGLHISQYDHGTHSNHDPVRKRRLLLHRREIRRLERNIAQKGFTVVPTRLYLKNGYVKIEIALARGKGAADRREDIRERDAKRAVQTAMRR
jgi:SsrA-binding protein